MATDTEEIHRKLTEAYIEDNPRDIVFNRKKKVRTSAGGFRVLPDASLLPQRGRLVAGSSRGSGDITLPEGRVVSPTGTIVMPRGSDVKRHDTAVIDGMSYEVVLVSVGPWSVEASVINHAE